MSLTRCLSSTPLHILYHILYNNASIPYRYAIKKPRCKGCRGKVVHQIWFGLCIHSLWRIGGDLPSPPSVLNLIPPRDRVQELEHSQWLVFVLSDDSDTDRCACSCGELTTVRHEETSFKTCNHTFSVVTDHGSLAKQYLEANRFFGVS